MLKYWINTINMQTIKTWLKMIEIQAWTFMYILRWKPVSAMKSIIEREVTFEKNKAY